MLLHRVLGLAEPENLYVVEETYINLFDLPKTLRYLEVMRDCGDRAIRIIDGDRIIGLAVYNPETEDTPSFFAIFTNISNRRSVEFTTHIMRLCKNHNFESVNVPARTVNDALIEYYSLSLVNRDLCEKCQIKKEPYDAVYIKDRITHLSDQLRSLKCDFGGDMLEICCGNGMATLALRNIGCYPLSVDFDKCQICQGLEHGVLDPKKTIVMDAARLTRFFPENRFDGAAGFMLGSITPFSKGFWADIVKETVKVVKSGGTLLFTVNSKAEIDILKEVLDQSGATGRVIDATDAIGIYDQWIYLGKKKRDI